MDDAKDHVSPRCSSLVSSILQSPWRFGRKEWMKYGRMEHNKTTIFALNDGTSYRQRTNVFKMLFDSLFIYWISQWEIHWNTQFVKLDFLLVRLSSIHISTDWKIWFFHYSVKSHRVLLFGRFIFRSYAIAEWMKSEGLRNADWLMWVESSKYASIIAKSFHGTFRCQHNSSALHMPYKSRNSWWIKWP